MQESGESTHGLPESSNTPAGRQRQQDWMGKGTEAAGGGDAEKVLWEARARRELAEERARESGRDGGRENVGVRSLRKTYDAIVPARGDGMWDPDATLHPITGFWEGFLETKYDEIAKQVATTVGIDEATITFSGAAASKREAQRQRTGLEYANALISNGGLVMTQDLPKTEVRWLLSAPAVRPARALHTHTWLAVRRRPAAGLHDVTTAVG